MGRVVCSKCEVDPQIVTDTNSEPEAVCPSCGQRDIEDAKRIAFEHATNEAKTFLNATMRDIERNSSFMKVESEFSTGGDFKWKVVELPHEDDSDDQS